MAGPIGEAFVKIRPDFSTFEAEVVAGLRASAALTAGIVVPVRAAVSGAAAATAGVEGITAATAPATTATVALTAAQQAEIAASLEQATAAGTAAAGLEALTAQQGAAATAGLGLASAQSAAAAAVAAGGRDLSATAAATAAATAGSAANVAATGKAASTAAKGVEEAATASNALRGAIIGISRVTPVAIFGLGVVGTAAVAAAIGVRNAVEATAQFEQQLNIFQVVTQSTGDEMSRVSDLAQQLGSDISLPATSALDAADAMTELAKAGLSVFDVMDSVRGVLELAAAAGVSAGQAAQITAFALNAFALNGTEAVHVADLLAASSIAAQGEITDMALALEQSAAVAAQAGVSIDDTATAISLLAKSGLIGSDAGTSLRTFLLRLVPTTKEAAEFTRALGIEFSDAEGRLRPLPDILQQYHDALATLPPVLQQAALQQIFGQDAIRAASILAREGADGFNAMREQVERQGAAAEIAGARTKGLSGAAAGLQSSLEGLGITLGGIVDGPLARFIDSLAISVSGLDKGVEAVSGWIGAIKDFAAPDTKPVEQSTDEMISRLIELNKQFDQARRDSAFIPPSAIKELEDLRKKLAEVQPAGLQAAAGIEAARGALGKLQAETGRKLDLDPFPDREDVRGRSEALVAAQKELLDTLTTNLTGSLKLLANIGPQAEGAAADSARDAVKAAVSELKKLGPEGEAAIADLPARLRRVLKLATAAVQEEAVNFKLPLKFEISANTAELSGSLQAQLDDVNNTIAALTQRLANRKLTPPGTELFKQVQDALIAARGKREQILGQIKSQAQQAATDAEQKARDAAKVINDADQKVIDQLAAGREPAERRLSLAQRANEPSALVVALTRLRDRIRAEIAEAKVRIKDSGTLAKELDKLGDDLFTTVQDLNDAKAKMADAVGEKLQTQIQIAQLRENDRAELALVDEAIENAQHRIANWKKLGLVLRDEKLALAQLQKDREDVISRRSDALTERLGQQIQIADLRGNKQAELAAIDQAIANAQVRVKNWKKLGTTQTDEILALERLKKQRRDLVKEIQGLGDESQKGTTAFDLLKEFSDQFNQIAGNLVTPDQPFADPTGFTADIAQFLRRGTATAKITVDTTGGVLPPRIPPTENNTDAVRTNTDAITKLTNVLLGNTRTKSGPGASQNFRDQRTAEAFRFRHSLQALEVEEG